MQAYQQRVVEEQQELDAKITKLQEFMTGSIYPTLDVEERDRLRQQLALMTDYSVILGQRIAAFTD